MNCTPSLHSWYSLHIWAFNISVEFAGSVLDARSAVHGQWFSRLPAATSYDCPTQVTLPFVTGVLSKRCTIGSSRSVVQQTAGCDELWLSNASYFTIRHWRPVKATHDRQLTVSGSADCRLRRVMTVQRKLLYHSSLASCQSGQCREFYASSLPPVFVGNNFWLCIMFVRVFHNSMIIWMTWQHLFG